MTENVRIPTENDAHLSALFLTSQKKGETTADAKKPSLVVMVHGFPNGSKQGVEFIFDDLEAVALQEGFATLRFDLRDCGESDKTERGFSLYQAVEDIHRVLAWAAENEHNRVVFLAEGLGATLALSALTPQVDSLVMLYPILDPKTARWKSGEISSSLFKDIRGFNIVTPIENLTIPTLIQHGTADTRAPIAQLDLLRKHVQKNRRIEITSYENGEHGLSRLNERQMIFFHIRQFLQKYG